MEEEDEDTCFGPYRFEPEYQEEQQFVDECGDSTAASFVGSGAEPENPHEESRLGHTRWCLCEKCKAMPRALDCLCCAEDVAAKAKKGVLQCITLHEEFGLVCLERAVLV